ncbi:eIF-2-alpha kinase GCN2-like isoform X1 [Magnolia sinica]|uniref:eIF-2-alpha kinase GCN2-like isoform X1 n=1 Tax=Magnolia sinica TaxID=86752 RepID=UPI00265B3DBE|nr:eIF-2-alpha kinase GCN2-like isoform X1 [Magnolia sinica]
MLKRQDKAIESYKTQPTTTITPTWKRGAHASFLGLCSLLSLNFVLIKTAVLNNLYLMKRKVVKLLTPGGNMLELCHELHLPFVNWVITN